MMMIKTALLFCCLVSCTASNSTATGNIVELAVATPGLSTLVTALKAANLTGALSGKGPFTVFAPTNEAFAKLPSATLKHLLEPKNIKELQEKGMIKMVSYHHTQWIFTRDVAAE